MGLGFSSGSLASYFKSENNLQRMVTNMIGNMKLFYQVQHLLIDAFENELLFLTLLACQCLLLALL